MVLEPCWRQLSRQPDGEAYGKVRRRGSNDVGVHVGRWRWQRMPHFDHYGLLGLHRDLENHMRPSTAWLLPHPNDPFIYSTITIRSIRAARHASGSAATTWPRSLGRLKVRT